MALHTGEVPVFLSRTRWLKRRDSYPNPAGITAKLSSISQNLDDDILESWEVIQKFCSLVNLATEAQGRIPWKILLDTMQKGVYRLFCMKYDDSSVKEAVRLGLLVISTQVLLQWKFLKLSHTHLGACYRQCVDRLKNSVGIEPEIVVWILMIGAVSGVERWDDSWFRPWLVTSIKRCGVTSWTEMRELLESLSWIRLVQEKAGKEVFESVMLIQ